MGFKREDDFNAQGYVKVNTRIAQFRATYPQGQITTFRIDTPKGVSYKCVLCRDKNDSQEWSLTGIAPATGHAFIPYSLMGDKVEEYTETVAIGRALAILGFEVEKGIASAEEMDRFNNMKDKLTSQEDSSEEVLEDKPLPKLKASGKFKLPTKKEEPTSGETT